MGIRTKAIKILKLMAVMTAKSVKIMLMITAMLILSGCTGSTGFTLNPQELYTLPRLPAKYTELNNQLSEILKSGAEYAAPTSGQNIQSVQLVDLDGDGREEAVAFLRNSSDEKPLKVLIFTGNGDTYRLTKRVEGSGTSIYSVAYVDMDGDGKMEIAVGWKATAELQVLEIYALNREKPLLTTDYVKYAVGDLNEDGRQELVVMRTGTEGDSAAEYYGWNEDGTLSIRAQARISVTMAELAQQGRVRVGMLRNGKPALFVTGVTAQNLAVMDLLALRNGEFSNLVVDQATGVSRAVTAFYSLYPSDMNSDGITEVPHPVSDSGQDETAGTIPRPSGSEPLRTEARPVLEWRQYDITGAYSTVMRTYHNLDDGWYLRLPESWKGMFTTERSISSGDASVTFFLRDTGQPFLRISALTGSGREVRSVRGERFTLSRQPETIYTAELLEGSDIPDPPLTETDVRSAFSLILREWLPADY